MGLVEKKISVTENFIEEEDKIACFDQFLLFLIEPSSQFRCFHAPRIFLSVLLALSFTSMFLVSFISPEKVKDEWASFF